MDNFLILRTFHDEILKESKKPKLFDVFLSHKQSEAQDRAKLYKCELSHQGLKAFYDRDELEDKDWTPQKVIELVARSSSLVFFMTPTILNASWCLWELYIAMIAKIPVVFLMVDPWPNKAIPFSSFPFPPYFQPLLTHKKVIFDSRYTFDTVLKKVIQQLKLKKRGSKKTRKLRN
jgi:hypothetical protein